MRSTAKTTAATATTTATTNIAPIAYSSGPSHHSIER
jgi:hypothetical protein